MSSNAITSGANTTLVVMPTYNEAANVATVVDDVRTRNPDVHVLVVDDNSPDGTGQIAERLAASDPRVHVLHRPSKNGLGTAYLAGFRWALAREYTVIIEMDADGSHDPRYLPDLICAIDNGADVAIGSRYARGGCVENWPLRRTVLSKLANRYARAVLQTNIRDITAGFRAYRRTVLESLDLTSVTSSGYCFQIELAWKASQANFHLVETPITFSDRRLGTSKMRARDLGEAATKVTSWGLQSRRAGRPPDQSQPPRTPSLFSIDDYDPKSESS